MSRWKNALLRPFLAAVARPGLGNPHSPYETELMTAGAKPVAIMEPKWVDTRMQERIDNGAIVFIDTKTFVKTERIYCHRDEAENAKEFARIIASSHCARQPPSPEELRNLESFFLRPVKTPKENFQNVASWHNKSFEILMALRNGKTPPEVISILKQEITALPPLFVIEDDTSLNILDDSVGNNLLSSVDYVTEITLSVYAQKDKVEDGKELYARYYKNGEGYEKLSEKDAAKRIGRLLGFTENDLAWHTGEKYQNPVVLKFMEATQNIRQQARTKLMLMDTPRSGLG